MRLIYFVLFLSLVACKENTDTHDQLTDADFSIEKSSEHIDKTDSEQILVDPPANSQFSLPMENLTDATDNIDIDQVTEIPSKVSESNIPVVSSDLMGVTELESATDLSRTSSELNLQEVSSDLLSVPEPELATDLSQASSELNILEVSSDLLGTPELEPATDLSRTSSELNLPEVSSDRLGVTELEQILDLPQTSSESNLSTVDQIEISSVTIFEQNHQVNHLPSAADDLVSILEDQTVIMDGLLINDIDLDGDKIEIVGYSQAESGVVELVSNIVLKYIPFQDYSGVDGFSYTISDGKGGESTAQVILDINSVNDSPLARDDSYVVSQGLSSVINVISNDEGLGDNVNLSIQSFPVNGTLEILNKNDLIYTPKIDYFGRDSFVYQLIDSDGERSIASVRLNIECLTNCTQVFNLSWAADISSEVSTYRVYVGRYKNRLDNIFDLGGITNFDYTANQKGEYYFAISAFNSEGVESELSEVMKGVF